MSKSCSARYGVAVLSSNHEFHSSPLVWLILSFLSGAAPTFVRICKKSRKCSQVSNSEGWTQWTCLCLGLCHTLTAANFIPFLGCNWTWIHVQCIRDLRWFCWQEAVKWRGKGFHMTSKVLQCWPVGFHLVCELNGKLCCFSALCAAACLRLMFHSKVSYYSFWLLNL